MDVTQLEVNTTAADHLDTPVAAWTDIPDRTPFGAFVEGVDDILAQPRRRLRRGDQ